MRDSDAGLVSCGLCQTAFDFSFPAMLINQKTFSRPATEKPYP